jgi:hypothetical protein
LATDTQIGHFKATKLCTEICNFINSYLNPSSAESSHSLPTGTHMCPGKIEKELKEDYQKCEMGPILVTRT